MVIDNVEYNKKNLERCICKSCPVQMDSVCANDRKLKMMDMLQNMNETDLMPEPAHIAGIYCSIGKSTCPDIDTDQNASVVNVQSLKKTTHNWLLL